MRVTPYAMPNHHAQLDDGRRAKSVSLPEFPGVTITSDRRETAPTAPTLPIINIPKQTRRLSGAAREAAIEKRFDLIARRIASYRSGGIEGVQL